MLRLLSEGSKVLWLSLLHAKSLVLHLLLGFWRRRGHRFCSKTKACPLRLLTICTKLISLSLLRPVVCRLILRWLSKGILSAARKWTALLGTERRYALSRLSSPSSEHIIGLTSYKLIPVRIAASSEACISTRLLLVETSQLLRSWLSLITRLLNDLSVLSHTLVEFLQFTCEAIGLTILCQATLLVKLYRSFMLIARLWLRLYFSYHVCHPNHLT